MRQQNFEIKNSPFGKSVEVWYNERDQVIKAFNHAGVLVIDEVKYEGDTLISVRCPNVDCTFTRQTDGTYLRSGSSDICRDLKLLPNGLLIYRGPYGPFAFGTKLPEQFGGNFSISGHRCSHKQCYEHKAFDTFKRFWQLQDKSPLPSSTWHTSLHEAAHAAIAVSRGLEVEELTIVATEEYQGRVVFKKGDDLAHVDAALAGFVLDQACRVPDTGANHDLLQAYRYAIRASAVNPKALLQLDFNSCETVFSIEGVLADCIHGHPLESHADSLVAQRIPEILMELNGLADQLVAIAACAFEKKTIGPDEIKRILNAPASFLSEEYGDQGAELASAFSDLQLAVRTDKTLPT